MKRILFLTVLLCSAVLLHAQEELCGEWYDTAGNDGVVLVVTPEKLLYAGDVWDYNTVQKGSRYTLYISSGSVSRQLFVQRKKDGTLLLADSPKDKGRKITRERPCEPAVDGYKYNPQSVSPYFFTPGSVYIKGCISLFLYPGQRVYKRVHQRVAAQGK